VRPDVDPYEQFGCAALQRLREQEQVEASRGDSAVLEDDDDAAPEAK
jgi:hypothetical protein